MLQNTDTKSGVTLLELLVAITITSITSVVLTQLLFDIVSSRSKQYAIQEASEEVRVTANVMRNAIATADIVDVVSNTQIQITAAPCVTYNYNASTFSIEYAEDASASCIPPTSGFSPLTNSGHAITELTFAPVQANPKFVTITIEGNTKDTMDTHGFSHTLTVSPRIAL